MSYCRFSTDDFQCDVYVYADISGGYTCHVKTVKTPMPGERASDIFSDYLEEREKFEEEAEKRYRKRMDRYTEELDGLGEKLPESPFGERFNRKTSDEMADCLVELRNVGFTVPDKAIERLRDATDMTDEELRAFQEEIEADAWRD